MKAMKSLRHNNDIRILQEDKGNCTVVLDESKYKDKLNTLLESGAYEPLSKEPAAQVERKVRKLRQSYPCNRPWRPIGLWDGKVPTFSRQSVHRWPYALAALYHEKDSRYSCVRG
jgi:hypothetical protein